jgi:hypothetical protein
MLLLGLNRTIQGNHFIQFETSVKALGLLPGDLITVTYPKENLNRTPFRVLKISAGPGFRTAIISAQFHNDDWYSDSATGIIGGIGWQTGTSSGLPEPVTGTVTDDYGTIQLGVTELEQPGSDGSASVELGISFTAPGGHIGVLPAPLLGLVPIASPTGGTLAGDVNYFYAISTIDSGGGESPLSFVAQAATASDTNTCSVILDGISLPAGASGFNVYRGTTPGQLLRIASGEAPQPSFTDTGLPLQAILPPDPQFDHVNVYWRWELVPETPATTHSAKTVGNAILQLTPNLYNLALVRITRGAGAGQECIIVGNDASTLTISSPWSTEPDATSFFAVSESAWRFGARGNASPIQIDVPERMGSGVQISARAANVANHEADYAESPITRWTIGQSSTLHADSAAPRAPMFGLTASSIGGMLDLSAVAFKDLVNTRGVIAGTYSLYFYDEVNGLPPVALSAPVGAADTTVRFASPVKASTFVQVDSEVMLAGDTDNGGNTVVQRGLQTTTATDHDCTDLAYPLNEKVIIVPFVKSFFGSPASGDWKYTLALPNVRLATAQLIMTNALGDGEPAIQSFTGTNDRGLRTLAGGQFSFQISGYLAIQTGAAPVVIVDADRSVRDVFGVLGTPSGGAGVTLQINVNGSPYTTVQFDPGASASGIVDGFGLPLLRAGDLLSLDVTGVGISNPGSDLTLVIRL